MTESFYETKCIALEEENVMLWSYVKTAHDYDGLCPDPLDPKSRDPDCPACKILLKLENLK